MEGSPKPKVKVATHDTAPLAEEGLIAIKLREAAAKSPDSSVAQMVRTRDEKIEEGAEESLEEDPYDELFNEYEPTDYFEDHKFDKKLKQQYEDLTQQGTQDFFDPVLLESLSELSAGERLVLVARASLQLQTRPSDIGRYLNVYPEDKKALNHFVMTHFNRIEDSLTWNFSQLLATHFSEIPVIGLVPNMREIGARRELAPDFLLAGYERQNIHKIIHEYGEASQGYQEAYKETADIDNSFDNFRSFQHKNI